METMTDLDREITANPYINMPQQERWLSAGSGLFLVAWGLTRKTIAGLGIAITGAYLLFRGVYGRCLLYELFGLERDGERGQAEVPPPSVAQGDEVTESSWESFPTSDPPAWTSGR